MAYTAEQREAAIARVIEGLGEGTPLTVLCREEGMPSDDSVRAWAKDDEALSRAIACAREAGFDAIAKRARETARGMGDSSGDVQRDKLIIDTDLKLLAKWDPKRYGELIKHAGADGEGPVQAALSVTFRKAE